MSRLSPSRWYRRSWMLHPALFAVYPIAAHLASNLSEVEPGEPANDSAILMPSRPRTPALSSGLMP